MLLVKDLDLNLNPEFQPYLQLGGRDQQGLQQALDQSRTGLGWPRVGAMQLQFLSGGKGGFSTGLLMAATKLLA